MILHRYGYFVAGLLTERQLTAYVGVYMCGRAPVSHVAEL